MSIFRKNEQIGTASGSGNQPGYFSTLAVTGTGGLSTGTGGQAPVNQLTGANLNWAMGGSPASGTHGNNTTMVAGSLYWAQIFVDCNLTLTGVSVLVGGTGGTDKWIVVLYDYQGNLLTNSALAGTNVSGTANAIQNIPFTATYAAKGPAYFFVALQSNGTTAKFQSYTTPGSMFVAGSTTGTFATLPNPLTVGSTYTNNVGPVSGVY